MCGKFTAMASWAEVVSFSQPLGVAAGDGGGDNDFEETFRPYAMLNVIVWDAESGQRKNTKMRWGLPDLKNYKKLKHIHARAETIETTKAFAPLFMEGRRGIVVMKTFNETPPDNNDQWTINPQDGRTRGFAFLCQGYDIDTRNEKTRLLACCMVTVAANALLRETILKTDPDPRMPAILQDQDWATWLGENDPPLDQVKAVLMTMEGENWTIAPESKAPSKPRVERNTTRVRPNPPSDPSMF
jgi:putative SOS response-associated peptidase YedK